MVEIPLVMLSPERFTHNCDGVVIMGPGGIMVLLLLSLAPANDTDDPGASTTVKPLKGAAMHKNFL